MAALAERCRRLLPGIWLGALLVLALVAAPAAFATQAPAAAGRVVGRMLAQEAWLSIGLALALLLVERLRARRLHAAGTGSVLSPEILLLLGTLFCTVAGHFAVQPMLAQARAGQGGLSFAQLHAASVVCYGVKLLLVAALAWRAASPR